MLVELAVKNLGVIATARIPFTPGLVALTGETGAGKTMLVEALNLLLGGRADPTRVREGESEAVVEGLFADGDDEWVLRRVVPSTGRSRCYINDSLTTAANLAELGAKLLEIHGQHAQQSLLQSRAQRDALDEFSGVDTRDLDLARRRVAELVRSMNESGGDERARAREIDLLRFQLDEINSVAPIAGEEETLEDEEDLLADALAHREAAQAASSLISDEAAAADLLARAIAVLQARRPFGEVSQRLMGIAAELAECVREVRSIGEGVEPDEARLGEVRARRQKLVELRRKYGDTIDSVIEYAIDAQTRLEDLTSFDATRAALAAELTAARAVLQEEAARVGELRRRGAGELARSIEQKLEGLAMASARVEVAVEDTDDLPGAGQAVEFRIAVNPGTATGPLSKVASGGELSRVMLALHMVLSHSPPTNVFDEVDAGIGGETALLVGEALAELGTRRQVLVVTHLAQVAAFADSQLLVAKSADRSTVQTSVTPLSRSERIIELSRMISGSPESSSAREHAEELLERAARRRDVGYEMQEER